MIIVTGASGQLGRSIIEKLLERMPADRIGASVRDPEKAQALGDRGVRVRRGDYADPASLSHAFEGATQVLIVSANTTGGAALGQHRAAIEMAKQAGARRILYTAHMGADPASLFEPMCDHAAAEEILVSSGVPFTSLRNGFYAATILMTLGRAVETGEFAAPEDGPVSWTSHADLATAAAIILADEGRFDGPTPPLTASEALDFDDIAAMASELAGRLIRRITISDEQHKQNMMSHGMPEDRAEMLLGVFRASRRGEFATVDPALEKLLGRPPMSARDFLAAHLPIGQKRE